MKIAEYMKSYHKDGDTYCVSIMDVPWYLEFWVWLWEKIDPCCRKPWRLWYPLVPVFHKAVEWKYKNCKEVLVEVSEEWAKEHYDWDWTNYEDLEDDDEAK